jgi:hypothetical protein
MNTNEKFVAVLNHPVVMAAYSGLLIGVGLYNMYFAVVNAQPLLHLLGW